MLTLLSIPKDQNLGKNPKAWFVCSCGKICFKNYKSVVYGKGKQDCGCVPLYKSRIKHGMYKTRPYRIWVGLIQRCTNNKNPSYANYGGRGITHSPKWKTFEGFWEDMQHGYNDLLSIDRIDNNKGYFKENCHWATPMQQAKNKRQTEILVTVDGKTMNLTNWAKHFGISKQALQQKYRMHGNIFGKKTLTKGVV